MKTPSEPNQPSKSPASWYILIDGVEEGPVVLETFLNLVTVGRVQADTLVRKQGMDRWVRARQVKGLFDHVIVTDMTTGNKEPIPSNPLVPPRNIPPPSASDAVSNNFGITLKTRLPLILWFITLGGPIGRNIGMAHSDRYHSPSDAALTVGVLALIGSMVAGSIGYFISGWIDNSTNPGPTRKAWKWTVALIGFMVFCLLNTWTKPGRY